MKSPVQLRYRNDAREAPEAWFLSGTSVERWLQELCEAGLADAETRLFIVPRSARDPSPVGLLAVPGKSTTARQKPAGVACRRGIANLFIPIDARLHPEITEEECHQQCPFAVSFYHPAFGLSGFEEESALRVWQLLALPGRQSPLPPFGHPLPLGEGEGVGSRRANSWNAARPGPPPLPDLAGILLAQAPALADIFGDAAQEIGSKAPADLPPAPAEQKNDTLSNTARSMRQFLARNMARLLQSLPHHGQHRTWVNEAEEWAQRQMAAIAEQLEKLRNKELHRLLQLLTSDPENGLRHAIPLSHFAHRGLAPPTATLGPHSLTFDPSRLGGGPADFWQVTPDLQNILRQRYREMADREMQLGRHQRAAYIYAQLLGDLVAAANALKQGGYFREAALIYEEHLGNFRQAAQCLAEGGLLLEAIERFEKLECWLEVAELRERLGQRQEAEAALRRVVNKRLAQDDILGAAKLVRERLHQPDEALELLLRAWPTSRQAAACVGAALQLAGCLGRHETAAQTLAQFRREPPPSKMVLPLLEALGEVARDYPHDPVRHAAADLSRQFIARELNGADLSTDSAARLMQCLQQLAPEDRLLTRDTNRHLAGRRTVAFAVRRASVVPVRGKIPGAISQFALPPLTEWLALRRESHWFFAAGITENRLIVGRGSWEGDFQSASWDCSPQIAKNGLIMEPTCDRGAGVALVTPGGPPLAEQTLSVVDHWFERYCLVGTPAWLPTHASAFTFNEESCWSGYLADGRAILSCHHKSGRLQQTVDVSEELVTGAVRDASTRFCLKSIGDGVAVALGNRLVWLHPEATGARPEGPPPFRGDRLEACPPSRGDGLEACPTTRLTSVELPGQVVGLVATLPHTRPGVVALLDQGAALCWRGKENVIELERDQGPCIGTFVHGGPLVLASRKQLSLVEVNYSGVQKVTRTELPSGVVGLVDTAQRGQFATLNRQGQMTLHQLER